MKKLDETQEFATKLWERGYMKSSQLTQGSFGCSESESNCSNMGLERRELWKNREALKNKSLTAEDYRRIDRPIITKDAET